jgi:ribosome-binding ATPase YchF (GTP1/OBG family)
MIPSVQSNRILLQLKLPMSASFDSVNIRIPINISGTDIAGLVGSVCTGEGLRNEFLSHIRAVNGISEVIR